MDGAGGSGSPRLFPGFLVPGLQVWASVSLPVLDPPHLEALRVRRDPDWGERDARAGFLSRGRGLRTGRSQFGHRRPPSVSLQAPRARGLRAPTAAPCVSAARRTRRWKRAPCAAGRVPEVRGQVRGAGSPSAYGSTWRSGRLSPAVGEQRLPRAWPGRALWASLRCAGVASAAGFLGGGGAGTAGAQARAARAEWRARGRKVPGRGVAGASQRLPRAPGAPVPFPESTISSSEDVLRRPVGNLWRVTRAVSSRR